MFDWSWGTNDWGLGPLPADVYVILKNPVTVKVIRRNRGILFVDLHTVRHVSLLSNQINEANELL